MRPQHSMSSAAIRMSRVLAWGALLITLMVASFAHAADSDESPASRAKRLFAEAMAAYDHGELNDAIAKLREAQSLAANPQVVYNLAQFLDAAGRKAEALAAFEAFLAEPHPFTLAQRDA